LDTDETFAGVMDEGKEVGLLAAVRARRRKREAASRVTPLRV
jgi:hypothetical protein